MFDVNCQAEIKKLNVRTVTNNNEISPAIDITMVLKQVPVKRITSAGDFSVLYNGDVVLLGEVNPHTVQHKLENLAVTIGAKKLSGCDIKKGMKITLLPEKQANIELKVEVEYPEHTVYFMGLLASETNVKIEQRQLSLVNEQ